MATGNAPRTPAAFRQPIFLAGLTRYDTRRDPWDRRYVEQILPAEPGIAHAVRRWPTLRHHQRPKHPQFLPSYAYLPALCGAYVKVLLPIDFDEGDPDGCQSCAVHVHNGTSAPLPLDEYDDL